MRLMQMPRMWELRQSAQADAIELYIYGDVKGDGYDYWSGEEVKSDTSAQSLRKELEKHADVKNIHVFINSEGGSVFEGVAIYNQLKRHAAYKTVYIDGFACSVASVIAMAGDKVIMPHNALMMIHNAWTFGLGNAKEFRKLADDLDVIMRANRQAYLQKAGDKLDEQKLVELLDAETWLTAEECLGLGLADEYADKEGDIKPLLEWAKHGAIKQQWRQTLAAKLGVALDAAPNKEAEDAQKRVQKAMALFRYYANDGVEVEV